MIAAGHQKPYRPSHGSKPHHHQRAGSHFVPKRNRGDARYGPQRAEEEVELDLDTMLDIRNMREQEPIFAIASDTFMGMSMNEPFSFSVPSMKLMSTEEMSHITATYWMPFMQVVRETCKDWGFCPVMLKEPRVPFRHRIPVVPDFDKGFVTVAPLPKPDYGNEFRWYWNNGVEVEYEPNMLWIRTTREPTSSGRIRSHMRTLLEHWRSVLKLRDNQNVTATQAARPVHVMARLPNKEGTAPNKHLTDFQADFGAKAAGVVKAKRQALQDLDLRQDIEKLRNHLQGQHDATLQQASNKALLWTETAEDRLMEMNAGFSDRVVTLTDGWQYVEPSRPQLVGSYRDDWENFNVYAAAIMDMALELLTPSGSNRTQNVDGATQFATGRVRTAMTFFEGFLRPLLALAYREAFAELADAKFRVSQLNGDLANVFAFFPELHIQIDMSSSSSASVGDFKEIHGMGMMEKQDVSQLIGKRYNIPPHMMKAFEWPDKTAHDLLVKPAATAAATSKPKKKKPKKT